MPSDSDRPPSLYMTHAEVAAALGLSRSEIPNKVAAGQLREVDVSTTGTRRRPRIKRTEFEAYCARLDAEGEGRSAWIRSYRRV